MIKKLSIGLLALTMSAFVCGAALPAANDSIISIKNEGTPSAVAINKTNFPDSNFRDYLKNNYDKDKNGELSDAELKSITSLTISDSSIESVTGVTKLRYLSTLKIEGTSSVTSLYINKSSSIKNIDISNSGITNLSLNSNDNLARIDASSSSVNYIYTYGCPAITSFYLKDCSKLSDFSIIDSPLLTRLDFTNNVDLKKLYIHGCTGLISIYGSKMYGIKSIDISNCPKLTDSLFQGETWSSNLNKMVPTTLYMNSLELLALDNISCSLGLGYCPNIKSLYLTNSPLALNIDLSEHKNLTLIELRNSTKLTNVTLGDHPELEHLGLSGVTNANYDLSKYPALNYLDLSSLPISDIDLSSLTDLVSLYLGDTYLTDIDISNNKKLELLSVKNTGIRDIDFSKNKSLETLNIANTAYEEISDAFTLSSIKAINADNCQNLKRVGFLSYNIESFSAASCPNLTYVFISSDDHLEYCFVNSCPKLVTLQLSDPNDAFSTFNPKGLDALEELVIDKSGLRELNTSYLPSLKLLSINNNSYNGIKLDLSKNTQLTRLLLQNSNIKSIDVSMLTDLADLYVNDNQLTTLNVTNNKKLEALSCGGNAITELDLHNNTKLVYFDCSGSQIANLDLTNNKSLKSCFCQENGMKTLALPESETLVKLNCIENDIDKIDLYKCSSLAAILDEHPPKLWDTYYSSWDSSDKWGIKYDAKTKLIWEAPVTPTPRPSLTIDLSKGTITNYTVEQDMALDYLIAFRVVPVSTNKLDGYGEVYVLDLDNDGKYDIATPCDGENRAIIQLSTCSIKDKFTLSGSKMDEADFSSLVFLFASPDAPTPTPKGGKTATPTPKGGKDTPTPTGASGKTGTPTPTPKGGTPAPTGSVPSDDPKAQILAFVERIYIYVLDREPEADGSKFWSDELYAFRRTGAEVAQGFIFSQEFADRGTTDEQFVTILYKTFFGRDPEEGGMKYWLDQLATGTMDRVTVANGFIYSQEWADTCASYGIRSGGELKPTGSIKPTDLTYSFVERMYTTAMDRGYDAEGREYWASLLANFETTGEAVGACFFLSDEMNGYNLSDAEFLNRLYLTFMDRESDADGAAYWLGVMASGTSRSDVVFGFTRSPEFTEKCVEARILPY